MAAYKIIEHTKLRSVNSGCYGEYRVFRNKKKGVKLFFSLNCNTKADAIYNLKKAKPLYNKLVKASKLTTLVPRPYGLVIVKNGKNSSSKYSVGYMMSHINGKTLSSIYLSDKDEDRLERLQLKMTKKLGIYMGDNHSGNVMKVGKRFIFINADRFEFYNTKQRKDFASW